MSFPKKIIAVLLLFIVTGAQAQLEWEYVSPLRTARSGHATVSYEGNIYVIGGVTTRAVVLNTIEIYDPTTDQWKDGPTLPIPLYYHNAVVANDTIYIIGGISANGRISNQLFKYTPGRGILRGTDLPDQIFASASVYKDGKILVMGGRQSDREGEALRSGYEFNLRTQSWSETQHSLNFGRSNFCLTDGDYTLAFGGIDFEVVISVERLTPEGWGNISRMPVPRGHFQGVALGNRVIIGGGVGQHQRMRPLTSVDLFIINRNQSSWEQLPDMLEPRTDFTMTTLDGHVYAIGGMSDARHGRETFNDSVERLSSQVSAPQNELPTTPKLTTASPNPTNGLVKFSFPVNAVSIQIVDIHGHTVETRSLIGQNMSWVWNTESVPAGLYFYVLDFDKYTPKVINRITVLK